MSDFGYIKVAAVCPETTVANPSENLKSAIKEICKAAADGCQIICLPELYLSAYTCGDLFKKDKLISECEKALCNLVEETEKIDSIIIVGLPVKAGYSLFDCAAVIRNGEIIGIVPKIYTKGQSRYFTSGAEYQANEIELCGQTVPFGSLLFKADRDFTFGIEIGDDINAPVPPSSSMALCGANVIFNPCADQYIITSRDFKRNLISQQSAKCICGYISASAGMGESTTDQVYSGDCLIAENGKVICCTDSLYQPDSYVSACIDSQMLNALRYSANFDQYKTDGCYTTIRTVLPEINKNSIDRYIDPNPFTSGDIDSRCKDAFAIQSAGLAKRMKHTGIKKLVIGISGGMDSTLALLVAHKAIKLLDLPESNIISVTMPGFGTTSRTYNNAVDLIKALGSELREIDIKAASIQHMKDIGHDINIHDITYENTQARERTQILMDIANKEGALLVGTGDLSEGALGWCTYNGDHMSMYNVNCGIPKTFARKLVEYCVKENESGVADTLLGILDTPVSPELLPPDEQGKIKQKTEDKLGPYEVHDFYLYNFIRFGFTAEKLLFIAKKAFEGKYDEEQLSTWLNTFIKRFFTNQFKRSCVPDGPKVGTVGLSPRGDWQMPSDADFSTWLD